MALKLGELVAFLKTDNSGLRRGLAEGEAETRLAGQRMNRSMTASALSTARAWLTSWAHMSSGSRQAHRALHRDIDETRRRMRDLIREFAMTGDKTIKVRIDQERSQLASLERAAASLGRGGFRIAFDGLKAFGGGLLSVATMGTKLIGILYLLVAVMGLVQGAGVLLGGLLGAMPGIITGGIAAVGALALGFIGLGDAFKETSRAGGSMVDRARQIALAERRLADANREAAAAQKAVNDARKAAAERMQDLAREVAGARLDEEAAVQALADAERDLERARLTEDPTTIARADLARRQAVQRLAEIRDRLEDLTEEQEEATQKGIEGSDEVTSALERQRRAIESISDAEYELQRARLAGSGGGGAEQLTEIADSAKEAVRAIKSLGPAWTELRLLVQQRLFAGIGDEIVSLSDAWMPTLRTRLGGMADMFNGLFKEWAETSRDPEFIANIAAGWKSVEEMIDRIGRSVAGPGLEAFGRLSRAAGPMIDAIGEGLGGIIDDFARWIEEAEQSGELQDFFVRAGDFFHDVLDMGKHVTSIITSLIEILFDSGQEQKQTAFDGFNSTLEDIAEWLDDPANQEKVRGWIEEIMDFFFWIKDVAIPTVIDWIDRLQDWADRIGSWISRARQFGLGVKSSIDIVTSAILGLPATVRRAASGLFDPIVGAFRAAMNAIIDRWNRLEFTIGGATVFGVTLPGATFRTPDIPRLAEGGFIPATPGGRLAVLGEAGKDEFALPDDKLMALLEEASRRGARGSDGASLEDVGDIVIENHIEIGGQVVDVVEQRISRHDRRLKRRALAGAGSY